MRTTLTIDDDVLQAAKELAERSNTTAGHELSALARKGLQSGPHARSKLRHGVPVLPRRGDVITLEHVDVLMDREGI